jgi:hypothetical protein
MTYRSSIDGGCSFTELADMNLMLVKCDGNDTHAATGYIKKYSNHWCHIIIPFLPVGRWLRKTGKFKGLRWDPGRRPRSVCMVPIFESAEGQPAVSSRCLAALTGISYASVPERLLHRSHLVFVRISNADASARRACGQWIFIRRPKPLRLQRRFYSHTNRASLGLGSPEFTMYMRGQMEMLMRFDLTTRNESFPSMRGLEF